VADVLHLDEGGVADLRRGAGAVTGGGEVVVVTVAVSLITC
jgi:hypothetical protein